jgi:hypothetical protein
MRYCAGPHTLRHLPGIGAASAMARSIPSKMTRRCGAARLFAKSEVGDERQRQHYLFVCIRWFTGRPAFVRPERRCFTWTRAHRCPPCLSHPETALCRLVSDLKTLRPAIREQYRCRLCRPHTFSQATVPEITVARPCADECPEATAVRSISRRQLIHDGTGTPDQDGRCPPRSEHRRVHVSLPRRARAASMAKRSLNPCTDRYEP